MTQPATHERATPRLFVVPDAHPPACDCLQCEIARADAIRSAAAYAVIKRTLLGLAIGTAIAAAIDPASVAAAWGLAL